MKKEANINKMKNINDNSYIRLSENNSIKNISITKNKTNQAKNKSKILMKTHYPIIDINNI